MHLLISEYSKRLKKYTEKMKNNELLQMEDEMTRNARILSTVTENTVENGCQSILQEKIWDDNLNHSSNAICNIWLKVYPKPLGYPLRPFVTKRFRGLPIRKKALYLEIFFTLFTIFYK